jgi:hypothetical protein
MGKITQIKLHTKCIWWDLTHHHLERVTFHLKGIARAILSKKD